MSVDRTDPYAYRQLFFDYIESGARRSARTIIPHLTRGLFCRSVLDVGCGAGAWLAEYRDAGVEDVTGVDGDYVDRRRLLVPPDRFRAVDVSRPFDLGRRFDLVQSLEVAEHLPQASSRDFVGNLAAHGDRVLFSAAVPGQGGENHTNERPLDFWRGLFAERGFVPFDYVRPLVAGAPDVEPWYAYNTLLYVRQTSIDALPESIRKSRVKDDEPIANVAPLASQVRYALLRPLPVWLVSRLAVLKHRWIVATRGSRS
jgi:SAM-dependent methyltransferase